MLRLSYFSCIFLVCNFMYNSYLVSVVILSGDCYRCQLSGSQFLRMALVVILVTWLQPHRLFNHPQDSQLPLEALSQVLLPIMWLNTGMSLSFYGMLFHVASPSWKSDLTLNWWFPRSIELIKCRTLFYYISLCKLGYWKEILSLLHSIIFQEIKIH